VGFFVGGIQFLRFAKIADADPMVDAMLWACRADTVRIVLQLQQ
jgi:hypothetical protein